jgi:hypothetical protein
MLRHLPKAFQFRFGMGQKLFNPLCPLFETASRKARTSSLCQAWTPMGNLRPSPDCQCRAVVPLPLPCNFLVYFGTKTAFGSPIKTMIESALSV